MSARHSGLPVLATRRLGQALHDLLSQTVSLRLLHRINSLLTVRLCMSTALRSYVLSERLATNAGYLSAGRRRVLAPEVRWTL